MIADQIRLGDGTVTVVTGKATTRAQVLAQCPASSPDNVGIGSLYLSSAGKMYVRVAAAGAATDWEKVTSTAAD